MPRTAAVFGAHLGECCGPPLSHLLLCQRVDQGKGEVLRAGEMRVAHISSIRQRGQREATT